MAEHGQKRYYASEHYPLPADEVETARLNLQHQVIVQSFENRLSLVPVELKSGDRVLESAAGTGIWALEFFQEMKKNGIILDVECIDISDRQFPAKYPSNIRFSVHSVTDLPAEWSARFAYVHQRMVLAAMNETRWRQTITEIFRVLASGGWVELVETEAKHCHFDAGPSSTKLQLIQFGLYNDKGLRGDTGAYLPPLLEEIGFVDVRCEVRHSPIGQSGEKHIGFSGDEWGQVWRGLKRSIVEAGGYGFVKSSEEYEQLVDESVAEWDTNPDKVYNIYYTILGRKP
ncbi:hypothetical protein GYMLUDRAFT_42936 [Collybiopsis luxurians FD-317 M1]|uniref:Methyltransferase domain-containing protein n=1 Tax=Collybiopsis luxurians FD-317 M1 TaxID=944289 RepID=A0A0D0CQM4_9AGAR|nr:hypothetical protein GYMLUDRAFT_42936 [Collybiopsis luxurians FD-317 M1]